MDGLKTYFTALKRVAAGGSAVALAALMITTTLSVLHFPYDVDAPLTRQEVEAARKFYTDAYRKPVVESPVRSEYETKYLAIAEGAAEAFQIEAQVRAFVHDYQLADKPVLEIGSGRGYLQDLAQNYTGLDISPSVERFYHKKFVLGSATALPFPENHFDGVWSIWVFEHVANPEQAFNEARRVTKDRGVLFLLPAWNCVSWAAEGYEVRPYADLGLGGKLVKASIPIRSSHLFRVMSLVPVRALRTIAARQGPTRLRYRRLTPNYEKYWVADGDAVNAIDIHEAMLWFLSRGDECLNCEDDGVFLAMTGKPLIIRVHKSSG
ncbi:MAG: class I SAM-dependent methyltransferase [Deltaproteobacteria bacterium]|nr:class I SAM-dependent methyltransferase [Deltaproteobacteria bacterium]